MHQEVAALFSIPCHRLIDGGEAHGRLSMINGRLRFESESIQTEWIPFHSILGLEATGQTLTVLTRKGLARYHSTDSKLQAFTEQLRRLKRGLNPSGRVFPSQLLFEKAIVSSPQNKSICGVYLDDSKLRVFHTNSNLAADLPLDSIDRIVYQKLGLHLEFNGQKRTIHGSSAKRLASFLNAMEHNKGPPYRPIIQSWQAMVKKGWLSVQSIVTLSDTQLVITPLKSIDFFAKPIQIRIEDIAELQFETHALMIRCHDLEQYKMFWDESSITLGRRLGLLLTQTKINEPMPSSISENALICGPATLWHPNRTVKRGHMSATAEVLKFAAIGEIKPSLSLPLKSICRNDDSDSPMNTLPLRSQTTQLCFHPQGGESFVNDFYTTIKPPHRRIAWRGLTYPMQYAWVNNVTAHIQGEDKKSMTAMIKMKDDKLFLHPIAGDEFNCRQVVFVEFHSAHGRMKMECEMRTSQERPNAQIEISPPLDLELISQRAIARLMIDGWIQGIALEIDAKNDELLPTGSTLSFELRNISERGCGLSGTTDIKVGDRLLLGLDGLMPATHIQAECVYAYAIDTPSKWRKKEETVYFYGFQFVLQSMGLRRKMNRIISRLRKSQTH